MCQPVQSVDAGLESLWKTRVSAALMRDRATRGQVAVGRVRHRGVTWRWKGATVSAIILVLVIAAVVVSAIAVGRAVARDGHRRRPEVGAYDSRRPTL